MLVVVLMVLLAVLPGLGCRGAVVPGLPPLLACLHAVCCCGCYTCLTVPCVRRAALPCPTCCPPCCSRRAKVADAQVLRSAVLLDELITQVNPGGSETPTVVVQVGAPASQPASKWW